MKKTLTFEVIRKRTIEYESIDETYCNYSDSTVEITNGKETANFSKQGIATIKEVENIKYHDPINREVDIDWMYHKKGHFTQEEKEKYEQLMRGELHVNDLCSRIDCGETDDEKYKWIIFNFGSWEMAGFDKEIIPFPWYFDYCAGQITDSRYDLKAVLEFMKSDSRFLPAKFNGDEELHIMKIPYYNADEYTGYHAIEFCYLPSKEEAHDMFDDRYGFIQKLFKKFELKK